MKINQVNVKMNQKLIFNVEWIGIKKINHRKSFIYILILFQEFDEKT
jgi:hypothetical protein